MTRLTISAENLGPLIQVINPLCLAWIVIAVGGRVATKTFVVRRLTRDDMILVCCLVLSVGQTIAVSLAARYGLGQHEDSITSTHLSAVQKSIYAAKLLYIPNLVLAKLGVSMMLMSITPVKSQRMVIYGIQGFIGLWGIASEFATAFECQASRPWDWSRESCLNRKAIGEFTAAGNLISEVALIVMPCFMIARLKNKKIAYKVTTTMPFALRILAVAAIATQMAYLVDETTFDLSYNLWKDIVCIQATQCTVIVCTCFIFLRPYLEWLESGFLRVDDLRRKSQKALSTDKSYSNESMGGEFGDTKDKKVASSIEDIPADRDKLDSRTLMRMGKIPSLKRTFGFMPSLGFSCSLLITWEGVNTNFVTGLNNGGPAGLVYGYLFIWLGNFSVFLTLSELASMAPISSGQYHWVSMLAPYEWHKFLSYLTGWFTLVGWQAMVASEGFLSGTMIQGLIVMTDSSYEFHAWHGTLIFWASIVFAVFVNTVIGSALPKFEGLIMILHVAGFFAILIPLVVLGPYNSASDVFTNFINSGNWPTQGVSFFVGLLGNVYAFFGADGAIHMSEEIRNAPVVVPRSMLTAVAINGVLGFAMLLGLLFCLGDTQAALDTPTGYPFMEVYSQAVQSTAGAATMASFIVVMNICATVAMLASSSRVLWAFSRDRAVPGWRYLQRLDSRTSIPVLAITATTVVSFLLGLIIIGSSTVFNDVIGLSVSGIYSSYIMVSVLLLWRRCRGDIHVDSSQSLANVPGKELVWGPWRIHGALGILNNVLTCCFLLIVWFFSFWPPATPVTASTTNYNSLMLGATAIFSVLYYFVTARKTYSGPHVETQT